LLIGQQDDWEAGVKVLLISKASKTHTDFINVWRFTVLSLTGKQGGSWGWG